MWQDVSDLVWIKLLHTAIWCFFAGCILALPVAGMLRRFRWAAILTTLVLVECAVLALNHFRCPLTDLAARYTQERSDNFDIYLPLWLARYTKPSLGHSSSQGDCSCCGNGCVPGDEGLWLEIFAPATVCLVHPSAAQCAKNGGSLRSAHSEFAGSRSARDDNAADV